MTRIMCHAVTTIANQLKKIIKSFIVDNFVVLQQVIAMRQ